MKLIARLHVKFGDFWWWSLCLFVALRCGDAINAFVGLWLVPKYVPQAELGAVLPLLQVTSVFGLPISVLVITFTKFLNQYKTQGEDGKVKSLIRTFWGFAGGAILFGTGLAIWLMPHFFERIRVQSGSLGILIVATAVLSTTAPVFTNALQALMKFRALTVMNLFCAPIRLLVMLVAMPIRALSGYMVGQAAPYAFQIVWSWFALRHDMRPEIASTPFWREDGKAMLRFSMGVLSWLGLGSIAGTIQTMIIRQRLPEMESAAYYMISRFAELATYAGLSLVAIMFPHVAKASVKGGRSLPIFLKTSFVTLCFGVGCTLFLAVFGKMIFGFVPTWRPYQIYVGDMVVLAVTLTIGLMGTNFGHYEIAQNHFAFLWVSIPLVLAQMVFCVCFTGYHAFDGLLPDSMIEWMASCRIDTLHNFLLTMLVFAVLNLFGAAIVLFIERHDV